MRFINKSIVTFAIASSLLSGCDGQKKMKDNGTTGSFGSGTLAQSSQHAGVLSPEVNAGSASIPAASHLSEVQWEVAAELKPILEGPEFVYLRCERPKSCPPASVQVGEITVEFEPCEHFFCTSKDKKFLWSVGVESRNDLIEKVIARTSKGVILDRFVVDSVKGVSPECARCSKLKKIAPHQIRNRRLFDVRDPRNAIRVGIHAIRALEAIHSVGLVYRSATMIYDMRLRMEGDVPAWDQPGVLELDNLGLGALFVNLEDHTHLSPKTQCKPIGEQLNILSPGEIQGYCSTRADDMYRLSEALFWSCGSIGINIARAGGVVQSPEEWIRIKQGWKVSQSNLDLDSGIAYNESNEKYYAVLNDFHGAMFVLSNDRSMEKPDYAGWIERFNAVLEEN